MARYFTVENFRTGEVEISGKTTLGGVDKMHANWCVCNCD